MYSPLESIIGHYRGEQDSLNSVAAATLTGVMYKSTGKGLVGTNTRALVVMCAFLCAL